MKTDFAPAKRVPPSELQDGIQCAAALPLIGELTQVLPDPFFILNRHRQIIYRNKTLIRSLGIDSPKVNFLLRAKKNGNRIQNGSSGLSFGNSENGCQRIRRTKIERGRLFFCPHRLLEFKYFWIDFVKGF